MNSSHHTVLSLVASLVVVGILAPPAPIVHVAVGTVVGVAIDVDHFLLSRVRRGDWRATHRVLANPALIVTDPGRIFADAGVGPLDRLLTHVLLAGVLSAVAWVLRPTLGVVVGTSLYVHVLADCCWDVWRVHRGLTDPPGSS